MKFSSFRLAVGALLASTSLLSIFSVPAHAGSWSGPEYMVSNRLKNGQPDPYTTNADDPQGGGTTNYQSSSVSGTVNAKFTWVTANPATDPPPTDVYVLEHGYADWTGAFLFGPEAQRESRSGPSFQIASFSSKHRARVLPAYCAGGGGATNAGTGGSSADDGLGHPEIVYNEGYQLRGVSQGYKLVVLHPAGNTVTTNNVTLSGTTGYNGFPSWNFNAQVMDVKMSCNGIDITSPDKPELPIMVGQYTGVAVSVSPLPFTVTYQWDDPGKVIKGYEMKGRFAQPNHNPPIQAEKFEGNKIALPASDLQLSSLHWYWYDGSFGGDAKELSCVVTVAGTPITIKGRVKVYRPRLDHIWATYASPQPPFDTDPLVGVQGNYISFGIHIDGVNFSAQATNPDVDPAPGQIALLQTDTFTRKYKKVDVNPHVYKGSSGSSKLDTRIDTYVYDAPTDTTRSIGRNSSASTSATDNPGVPINNYYDHVDHVDNFTMYLIYKPSSANSIWVVLGKVAWKWSVKAERTTAGWNITEYTPTTTGTLPDQTDTDSAELPEWSGYPQEKQTDADTIDPW